MDEFDPDKITNDLTGALRTRVGSAVAHLADKVRDAAPQGRTGGLKRGVKSKVEEDEETIRGIVEVNAPHAHLIEFGFLHVGGKYVPANPFMRRAWISEEDNIRSILGN